MEKLLLIPRAIADLLSVWNGQQTWKQKSSFTYTLALLKLKKWVGQSDTVIDFPLLRMHWKGCNNETLQYLVKEIFFDEVYQVRSLEANAVIRILDLGSNIGLSVLYFKTAFPSALIEAFEPSAQSFALLQQNVEQNDLQQIKVYQCAITGNDEPLFFVEGYGPCSQNQQFLPTGNKEQPVPTQRLSELLQNRQYDLVKMDVEGAELEILNDVIASGCLNKVGCWFIEFHYPLAELEAILNAFKDQGFSCSRKKDVYCFQKIRNHKY